MRVSNSTIQHLLLVTAVTCGLAGCQSTSNRLSRLPGMAWISSNNDDQFSIAARDGSQLPPPSSVSEPYRPGSNMRPGGRSYDGSVASFDRQDRYPSTGYRSDSAYGAAKNRGSSTKGYQTGRYDAGRSEYAAREPDTRGAGSSSKYYDQFTGDKSDSSRGGGYAATSRSRYSEPASRYGSAGDDMRKAMDGSSNRYAQGVEDKLAKAKSRYSDAKSAVGRRASDVAQSLERRATDTTGSIADRAARATETLGQRASGLADNFQRRVDDTARTVGGVADSARDAIDSPQSAYAKQPSRPADSYVDSARNRYSQPSAYDSESRAAPASDDRPPATAQDHSRPWRPGSTSDYDRASAGSGELQPASHMRDVPETDGGRRY